MKKIGNSVEGKLKRVLEQNRRLKEQLDFHRIPVSEAAASLITYCKDTRDPLLPSIWGPVDKKDDPFAVTNKGGCCTVM